MSAHDADALGQLFRDAIVRQHREQLDYAGLLVADLNDAAMLAQPVQGITMNHPAWTLSHLAVYAPVLEAVLQGVPVEDPIGHRHGRNSQPSTDPRAYLPRAELIEGFMGGYSRASELFASVEPECLTAPTPIERLRPRVPTIAHLASHFLVKHIATHLGQLSAWRRAMGLPRV